MNLTTLDIVLRFTVAVGLAALLGLERTLAGKTAGMRTYAMVAIGSCGFIIVDLLASVGMGVFNVPGANPIVVEQAIVTGIGFIGAGLIIFQQNKVLGVTTAAGIWVAAMVGVAAGFGFFTLAMVATISALIVFTFLWFFETKVIHVLSYPPENENPASGERK